MSGGVFRMVDCPHKPACPSSTTTWNCGRRTQIERAMFRLELDRETGERALRILGLPVRDMSATERYNRREQQREKGLLF